MLITISREFGSGGRELGKRLADELSVPCYDNEIIQYVSQHGGFDAKYVAHESEKGIRAFYVQTIAHRFGSSAFNQAIMMKIDLAAAQRKILISLAEAGDCVIVGRAADIVLSQFSPFNIFVYASRQAKVERTLSRMKEGEKLSVREIEKKMNEIDRQRAACRADFSSAAWGDKSNYHLCINTTGVEIRKLIPSIAAYVKTWFEKE